MVSANPKKNVRFIDIDGNDTGWGPPVSSAAAFRQRCAQGHGRGGTLEDDVMGRFDLERFVKAQDQPAAGFASALEEMRAGGKKGHWIWYVLPQLSGLGSSPMARLYGLDGVAEARAYLRHPVLSSRLLVMVRTIAEHAARGADLTTLMGSPIDALKLVSSLTLFGAVAKLDAGEGDPSPLDLARLAEQILTRAEAQGLPRCRYTLDELDRERVLQGRAPAD